MTGDRKIPFRGSGLRRKSFLKLALVRCALIRSLGIMSVIVGCGIPSGSPYLGGNEEFVVTSIVVDVSIHGVSIFGHLAGGIIRSVSGFSKE